MLLLGATCLLFLGGPDFQVEGTIMFHPQIKIPQGVLRGESEVTKNGREFFKFWCIPYGKHKRFQASVPHGPWEGVLDATFCDIRCPQVTMPGMEIFAFDVHETEDCLILNVFTHPSPNVESGRMPVMVWIHGGYFVSGSSLDYSAQYLMDSDIVFITINYRLGALGFLTTGDDLIEPNLGMKDQVLALEWVKNNIQYFGGDPERITIFGESAGGVSVSLLILSPMAKGLFNYAIAQSGSSLVPFAYQSKPAENFDAFVAAANCGAPTREVSVNCLKELSTEVLKSLVSKTKWFIEFLYPMFPAVEWKVPNSGKVFLPAHPRKMLREGQFNKVPFIIGVNEDEGALQGAMAAKDPELVESLNRQFEEIGAVALGVDNRNISHDKMLEGVRKVRQFYFRNQQISIQNNAEELVDMFSDAWFVNSMDFTARHHAKHAPVYPYVFTKVGGFKMAEAVTGNALNRSVVSHGEELQYMFMAGLASGKKDALFSERFMNLWTSFARDGKPTGLWNPIQSWPTVKPGTWDYEFLVINDETSLASNPFQSRVKFRYELDENEWNELTQSTK